MTPPDALLRLVQWLSPSFPVGSFAYSQGLEWSIAQGDIGCAESLRGWLADLLSHGPGRSDAILLCTTLRAEAPPEALADMVCAMAPSRERVTETLEQGAAFARTVEAMNGAPLLSGHEGALPYPVAVGLAARALGLPHEQVAALFLQAVTGALVQVGVRFVPLGQTEGQAVLAALAPVILRVAGLAARTGPEGLASAALRGDIAAMRHETQDVRLYRS